MNAYERLLKNDFWNFGPWKAKEACPVNLNTALRRLKNIIYKEIYKHPLR